MNHSTALLSPLRKVSGFPLGAMKFPRGSAALGEGSHSVRVTPGTPEISARTAAKRVTII
jgi:hypothetical protein